MENMRKYCWIFTLSLIFMMTTKALCADDFITGVSVHLNFGRGHIDDTIKMISQAGFVSIRDEISWGHVESQKGKFHIDPNLERTVDEAIRNGITPLLILCYANGNYANGGYPSSSPEATEAFTRYCEFMVKHFRGRVKLFEFWNEWDYGTGMHGQPGDPNDYARLLKFAYPRIKAANPDALVIAGAVSDGGWNWTETVLKTGAAEFFDAWSIHPYTYKHGSPDNRGAEYFGKMITDYVALLKKYNNGQEKPIYITEVGYPTNSGLKGRSEADAAASLFKNFVIAKSIPAVKGLWWYDFMNDGWNSREAEDCFGLVFSDLTPKQAYFAMLDAAIIAKAEYRGRLDVGDKYIQVHKFYRHDKLPTDIWVVWNSHQKSKRQISLVDNSGKCSPLKLRHPGCKNVIREWGAFNWTGNRKYDKNRIDLCSGSNPWIIEGDLSGMEIAGVKKYRYYPAEVSSKVIIPGDIHISAKRPATPQTVPFSANWTPAKSENSRNGDNDLGAEFQLGWDSKNLYLNVIVRDDLMVPVPVSHGWNGDSLQVGLFLTDNGVIDYSSWYEIISVISPTGTNVLRLSQTDNSLNGMVNHFNSGSIREKNTTIYRLQIGATDFGRQKFNRGDVIGMSLLVNDNDGSGRKGWLYWGDGIATGKNADAYNWILLK